MPHRLVTLLRSHARSPLSRPSGTPGLVLSIAAFVASSLIVCVAVLAWIAVKSYLLCERMAWQMAKRMSGF